MKNKTNDEIMKYLLKNIFGKITITKLAEELDMTRVGIWKILKKIQSDKLIGLSQIGTGKTNTFMISLNWNNTLLVRKLALSLAEDAMKNERWIDNFSEIEKELDFLIIYGSILHSPKNANDIDILGVVSSKEKFIETEKIISKIQKTQIKKIHAILLTEQELKEELKLPNKAYIDAIKKGIILFGQEKFIKFIRDLNIK